MRSPQLVLHADLDAFYAQVEQLDDPALRDRAVLVGPPSRRGVVLTASYQARAQGVRSGMPMARALQRCPEAVVRPPRMERYVALSDAVMDVFDDFSPWVEPLSVDEAFLDMTGAEATLGDPVRMGRALKQAVRDATGLVISVGSSTTKYVAKVASAWGKPDGLVHVPGDDAVAFLAPLPADRLWGVGPRRLPLLQALGLHTIGDVQRADPQWLGDRLGHLGRHVHALAWARDPRPVSRRPGARSIGAQRTLLHDVSDRAQVSRHLRSAADRVGARLRRKGLRAGGLRVVLKTSRFQLLSRQVHLPQPTDCSDTLHRLAVAQLDRFGTDGPFRLVGLAAFDLAAAGQPVQVALFDGDARHRRLEAATDLLTQRFGRGAVVRASELATRSAHVMGDSLDALDARRDHG